MKHESNPPDASALMMSARSFGNYDLPAALADLIDNSIKARAGTVSLTCLYQDGSPEIRILDDGEGMSVSELRAAMRPASTSPLAERSPDDLGRFGWGMKSASFSQCRRLTVIARQAGLLSGCVWDLDDIDEWRMGILDDSEIAALASPNLLEHDGVEIIWNRCDRLSENGALDAAEFNALIAYARSRLALVFHRYLEGEVRGRRLNIRLNGQPVRAWDPFYQGHDATQPLEREELRIAGHKVVVTPFILPHYSKLKLSEHDQLGGEEGFIRNQGFYVYRNHRLILSGTWFRLVRHGELSQLVRVRIDIPNGLDHVWKITLDKADAQLPAALKGRLQQIVAGLRSRSAKVHRARGGRLDREGTRTVWNRHAKGGEIRYSVNRSHPLIAALLASGDDGQRRTADAAIRVIEQAFPVSAFGDDAGRGLDALHQTLSDPVAFRAELNAALPLLLEHVDGDLKALEALLRVTEPWAGMWTTTEELLSEKGWMRAEP